jgi:uncharacterized protein (DUF427 family)
MSLTSGRGPLGRKPSGRFVPPIPEIGAYIEPFRRKVKGITGDEVLIESESVLLVHRPGHAPEFAFPAADVGGLPVTSVTPLPEADGYLTVPWGSVDSWFEEEEEILLHPRNPYHRVDYLRTTRWLHVEVSGVVLVDTRQTVGVYETALEPRLYIARDQLLGDVLTPSDKSTFCPYKGTASYWHARLDGRVVENVAWSYEDPFSESEAIRGLLCFDDAVVSVRTDIPAGAQV